MILGFDWLQSVNLQVKWTIYGATLKIVYSADVPVQQNIKVELYSFKVLLYLMCFDKGANSWFTFV